MSNDTPSKGTQSPAAPLLCGGWLPMSSAPRNATEIEGLMPHGTILRVHFAEDLSGEDQPAFSGWFVPGGRNGFREVETPTAWRPIAHNT